MNKSCQRCGNIKVMGERDIKKRKKEKKLRRIPCNVRESWSWEQKKCENCEKVRVYGLSRVIW